MHSQTCSRVGNVSFARSIRKSFISCHSRARGSTINFILHASRRKKGHIPTTTNINTQSANTSKYYSYVYASRAFRIHYVCKCVCERERTRPFPRFKFGYNNAGRFCPHYIMRDKWATQTHTNTRTPNPLQYMLFCTDAFICRAGPLCKKHLSIVFCDGDGKPSMEDTKTHRASIRNRSRRRRRQRLRVSIAVLMNDGCALATVAINRMWIRLPFGIVLMQATPKECPTHTHGQPATKTNTDFQLALKREQQITQKWCQNRVVRFRTRLHKNIINDH